MYQHKDVKKILYVREQEIIISAKLSATFRRSSLCFIDLATQKIDEQYIQNMGHLL